MLAKNIAFTTKLSILSESYSSEFADQVESRNGHQITFGVGFRAFAY